MILFCVKKCFNRCFSTSSLRQKVYSNDTGDELITSNSAVGGDNAPDKGLSKTLGCLLNSETVAKTDIKMIRVSFDGVKEEERK
jgi:hypothetical protein